MSTRRRIGWLSLAAHLLAVSSLLAQGGASVSAQAQAPADRAAKITQLGTDARLRGENPQALEFYNQALGIFRTLGNKFAEADTLNNIGRVYNALGQNQNALDFFNRSLPVYRAVGNRSGEAAALNNIGSVYNDLGQKRTALEFYNQALPISRAAGNRLGEASTLNNIGGIYHDLGDNRTALEFYNQSLPIRRAVADRTGEAVTLHNIGSVYDKLGDKPTALEFYNQALPIRRAVGDRSGEAATLSNIGGLYHDLGQEQKALDFFNQSLPLRRVVGDRLGEAITLNNIGGVYYDLGQKLKALEFYKQSLPLQRAVGDRSGEAVTLNNIGSVYDNLGQKQKALELYNQALPIRRAVGDRSGEAATLNNIASIYKGLGQKQAALDFFNQALPLRRAVGDRSGEAVTLGNIGSIYDDLGDRRKALYFYAQSLPIQRAIGDRFGEATTLGNIGQLFDRSQPETAIFFAKQAVNVLQTIRGDNKDLEGSLRKSLEESVESYYRRLAGLLIDRNRFGEAEEVLNLLKNKEAADFIRRDAVADQLKAATLDEREHKALDRYNEVLSRLVADGQVKSALLAKSKTVALTAAENRQLDLLRDDLEPAGTVLFKYLDELQNTFAANPVAAKQVRDLQSARLQSVLLSLGRDVVAIYTLMLPDRYLAILVTGGTRKAYSTKISEQELNRKIFNFRLQLEDPRSNPLPLAQELYKIVFPEGLRQDLDNAKVKTIMWSIDSALRYVPIAALHDGKQYMVSAFRNSIIIPASVEHLKENPAASTKGLGFGVSKAEAGFSALPGVQAELGGIFQTPAAGNKPLSGQVLLDEKFTLGAFRTAMRQPDANKSVVHIATHFDSKPGGAADSRLLLGDGPVSLAVIRDDEMLFSGVDLLTLSACSTAYAGSGSDGHEVDSLGAIAQQLGANTVIASLWSVSDDATSRLMETMYRNRNRKLGKSEALKQAQQQMAAGTLKPGPAAPAARDFKVTGTQAPPLAAGWTHPYYWAAFILIGNWK